jgi:hypothetical protein
MNYSKHYKLLINRAKNRIKLAGYIENHHIVPKCLGGTDDAENICELTAEEHYVAHQLLAKMNPHNVGLWSACKLMSNRCDATNNKVYGWIRKQSNILVGKSISKSYADKKDKIALLAGFKNYDDMSKIIWHLFINEKLHYNTIAEKFDVKAYFVSKSLQQYSDNNNLSAIFKQGQYDLKCRSQKIGRSKFTKEQELNRLKSMKNIDYTARTLKTGSRIGQLNPTFGKTWLHIKMICPHCNKEVSGKRWHFDNCRSKNENQINKI